MEHLASLIIHATLKDLSLIRKFVERELEVRGVEEDAIYDLVYSVNELTTNTLVHGYGAKGVESGLIEVELHRNGHALWIIIRDQTAVYNPNDAPVPDITLPLEARKPGGLGIFLAKEFTDQIIHLPLENGGNEVILVKENVLYTQPD